MQNRNQVRKLGLIFFITGIILGLLFAGGSVWGDLEASLFDTSISADQSLNSLRCPVAISSSEVGRVTAQVRNPTDKKITRAIRAHISRGLVTLMDEYSTNLTLAPGEAQNLEWEVTSDAAVWGRIVLVRVFLYRHYPLPGEGGYCGILVVNFLGLKGWQVVALVVTASLVCLLVGLFLWRKSILPVEEQRQDKSREMTTMAVLLTAAMVLSLFGAWLISGLLLLGTILMIAITVESFLLSRQ